MGQEPLLRARSAVAVIFLGFGFGIGSWAVRIPDFKFRFDLTSGQVGLILFCASIATIASILPVGRAVAHFGSQGVLTIGAALFSIALTLVGFAPSAVALGAAFFALGAAMTVLDIALNAHAVTVNKLLLRAFMNRFHAMWSLGALIGAFAGGLAAQWEISTALHLMIVAALFLLSTWLTRKRLLPNSADRHHHERAPATSRRWPFLIWVLGLMGLAGIFTEGAATDWSALHLREDLSAQPAIAALAFTCFSFAMVIGRLSGDWFTERFGVVRTMQACGLVTGTALGGGLLSGTIPGALIGWTMAGLGASMIVPILFTAAGQVTQMPQGQAVAAVAGLTYAGYLIGPPLIGFLADVIGLTQALLIPAALALTLLFTAPQVLRPSR
jgi:MFS family permease